LLGGEFADELDGGSENDILDGGAGFDRMVGGLGNDTLTGGTGGDTLDGNADSDTLDGSAGNDQVTGGLGSDRLIGKSGNDILVGIDLNAGRFGAEEVDILEGGAGRDRFVLGDRGRVFYDDGNPRTGNARNYALIVDFFRPADRLQLEGVPTDYTVQAAPFRVGSSRSDFAIYIDKPGSRRDELIAIVQDINSFSLTAPYVSYV
jgi:Ca2+-binding RTX toxin-like protein